MRWDQMDVPWWLPTWTAFVGILMGLMAGYLLINLLERRRAGRAQLDSTRILSDARKDAEHILKEARLKAQDMQIQAQQDFERETREQRDELRMLEARIMRRAANLDRKLSMLEKKEEKLEQQQEELNDRKSQMEARQLELEQLISTKKAELGKIASLSQEEARAQLTRILDEEIRADAGVLIRHIQDEAKETAEKKAREIIAGAIQRYAASQVSDMSTSSVPLPNEEMKGRIIGREGRNIRALEAATGVDILIDDTPEVVVVSGFDPLRREIARVTLERLIADGRIHPSRIEDTARKVTEEVEEIVRESGEAAVFELGLQWVDPELIHTLGRLKYRYSFAQNVLQHSIEMAHLMAMMAAELGLDVNIAKRVGLFHDIGKALDHKVEGGHATIGADLLRKYGEQPVVVNAVGAHHGDIEPESIYATLVEAADAMSAGRPGARAETTQIYLKRLTDLENIASSFRGVEKSYAIQAGREIRVIVEPSKIDDNQALQMARNITKQIEHDLQYPGQIKVTVIRETRCVEYAK